LVSNPISSLFRLPQRAAAGIAEVKVVFRNNRTEYGESILYKARSCQYLSLELQEFRSSWEPR